MSLIQLLIKSFRHYYLAHLTVAAGIAISTTIIVGGLIVGDSVSHSLMESARYRTGKITHMVRAGDRFFTTDLARGIAKGENFVSSPVLQLEGIAVVEGGQKRLNRLQVWGLEKGFNEVAGVLPGLDSLAANECIISENVAERLGLSEGESFMLRIRKESMVPANAPFVSESLQTVSVRARVTNIAGMQELGRLNMHASQTAPYNVFLSIDWLNLLLEMKDKCNGIMISGDRINRKEIEQSLKKNWTAGDAGLNIKYLEKEKEWKISTGRVFIDAVSAMHLKSVLPGAEPIISYFTNSISADGKSTPYSFVSSLNDGGLKGNEILINDWLAEDLGVGVGDTVMLKYFIIGPLRTLSETRKKFIVKEVVPLGGRFADRERMPPIPGLSDAGSCSEWEAGVPVDLERIRDKDENYWNIYRGTPKAYISLETAEQLWQNRFGDYTSFRIPAEEINNILSQKTKRIIEANQPDSTRLIEPCETDALRLLERILVADLSPAELGFQVAEVRKEADYAAANGVDFGQLFLGLSFFILVSGIILTVLLLNYNLMQRSSQTATLSALGFSGRIIRKLVIIENSIAAVSGTILGGFLAILYTKLVFAGLNRVWYDIVRTRVLEVEIEVWTVISGMLVSLLIAMITVAISTRRLLSRSTVEVQKGLAAPSSSLMRKLKWVSVILFPLIGVFLVLLQFFRNQVLVSSSFFLAGTLLLISILLLSDLRLRSLLERKQESFSLRGLRNRNLVFNRGRSTTIIILLALGTFLVISTGANRRDIFSGSQEKTSGTGGFLFFAESTVPVLSDANDPSVNYSLVQFRVNEGDDASCLNLNRISNPRIIATDPARLMGRFRIITSIEQLDREKPWRSLESEIDGLVPAIADQTVIQWGLGMKVGDTLAYTNEMGEVFKLLLVGGLAPSVFQGNVIISEKLFLKHYPSSSGSNLFLVDGDTEDSDYIENELNANFRDYGWEMDSAARRLSEFNSVSNTYLSIFLVMGTFGLILGTLGLAIILVRNIREQRQEIAYLSAAGFRNRQIIQLLAGSYSMLLIIGILGGVATAIIATLPVFLSSGAEVSLSYIGGLTSVILVNGLLWIWLLSSFHIRRIKISWDLRNE